MTSIVKRLINEKSAVLHLIKGVKESGEAFYAYVLFPADVYEAIKEQMETEGVEIGKYGIVIHSDYGEEPPEGLESKIIEYYKKNYLKNNEKLD